MTRSAVWFLSLVVAASVLSGQAAAPQTDLAATDKQRSLIHVLKSDAAPSEKALACKQLAIYGTAEAVPALEPLLADPQLASWARIALEAIPGSAPDAALRRAMKKLQGRLLVGTINSVAVRRDARAVAPLVKLLNDNDAQVGSAAAIALGRIGGAKAAKALDKALTSTPEGVRPAAAQGCLLCAEWFSSHGKAADATKMYEKVRRAPVPKHLVLEATRLSILAQQSAGLRLLLEQLRSGDKDSLRMGLRTARELAGTDVTDALVAEINQSNPDRQPLLLLAVADRHDASARSAILAAAKAGPAKLRVVAIGALEREGAIADVPVLLDAAVAADESVAQAAFGALTRLPGDEVNSDLAARLASASGKTRQVLIDLAGRRRIDSALPAVLAALRDPDAGIRTASLQTVGALGGEAQIPQLVRQVQHTQDAKERTDVQTALIAISTRNGAACVPDLLPLAHDSDSGLRLTALPVLAAAGGSNALAAVCSAMDDQDETVRDEAVRTLATWPNNWPEDAGVAEPLLALAKESPKTSHQVLALRGYLHFLEGDKQLKNAEKVLKIKAAMPLIHRPEEQQLTLGIIGGIPSAEALDVLLGFADESATTEEACKAILKLAGNKDAKLSKAQRQQALQTVLDKSKDDATRKRAERMLKRSEHPE